MKNYLIITYLGFLVLTSCTKQTAETKPIVKNVTETVFASGILEADGMYNLTAQNDGYLIEVNFQENDIVEKGDLLAVIDNKQHIFNTQSADALYEIAKNNTSSMSPSLSQAKNESVLALQKMILDSLQEVRYKKLMNTNSIAKIEYEQVLLQYQTSKKNYGNSLENYQQIQQQAKQQLIINEAQKDVNKVLSANNQIRAVIRGKVYQKFKQKGDFVKKGDTIATIGDANFIYAKVNIDENNIKKVSVGQTAVVQLNIDKEKSYQGRVASIYPAFDEATQSFISKISFDDTINFKIINTQLQANIIINKSKKALLIPRNYLGYGNIVKIKGQDQPVKVETQFISNDWVQILSGINENATIITDNIK